MLKVDHDFLSQYPTISFCLVYPHSKKPVGVRWEHNPLSLAEVTDVGNFGAGILCGYNGYILLDIDNLSLSKAVSMLSNITLDNGGKFNAPVIRHSTDRGKFIIHAPDWATVIGKDQSIHPAFAKSHGLMLAEYLTFGRQGVVSGIHPDTNTEYHIENHVPIPTLTANDLVTIALVLGGSIQNKGPRREAVYDIEPTVLRDRNMPSSFFLFNNFYDAKVLASKVSILDVLEYLSWDYSVSDANNYRVVGMGGLMVTKDGTKFHHFSLGVGGGVIEFTARYVFQYEHHVYSNQSVHQEVIWFLTQSSYVGTNTTIIDNSNQKYISINDCTHNTMYIAPTGSGKTTAFIEWAKRNNEKIVIALPTILQVKTLAKTYNGTALYTLVEGSNKDLIFSTYNSVHKVTNPEEYTLVIDEAHNIVTNLFRWKTMDKLISELERFQRVVFTTATYPMIFPVKLDVIRYLTDKPRLTINCCVVKGNTVQYVFNKVIENKKFNVKTLIFINNKRLQFAYKELLTQITDDIIVVNADDEDIKKGNVKDAFVLLCTSVLVDGHDLYTKFNSVEYIVLQDNKLAPLELVQFISRIRNVVPVVTVIWSENESKQISFNNDLTTLFAKWDTVAEEHRKNFDEIKAELPHWKMLRYEEPYSGVGKYCQTFDIYKDYATMSLSLYIKDLQSYDCDVVVLHEEVHSLINLTLELTQLEIEQQVYMDKIVTKLSPDLLKKLLMFNSPYTNHYYAWMKILRVEPSESLLKLMLSMKDRFTTPWYKKYQIIANFFAPDEQRETCEGAIVAYFEDEFAISENRTIIITMNSVQAILKTIFVHITPAVRKYFLNGKELTPKRILAYIKQFYNVKRIRPRGISAKGVDKRYSAYIIKELF